MSNDFRETLYTIDSKGRRNWVYSHLISGKFFKIRFMVAYTLMAIYLCLPWMTINNRQGVLLNIPERQFTIFGTVFWATDTYFLVLILGGLGISLFFFTAMFGRVWCGWACPETVFLEFLFRPLERLIEGSPAQRLRLDQQSWTMEKIWKKGIKHGLCALFAWILASTFLAYFIGREPLLEMMTDWPLNHPTPFFLTLTFMGVMGFQFGWFREQFCTVLCPYARFQSVMMDQNSIVVGYDPGRGEPRGKLKKNADPDVKRGDCVDCGLCIRVCPTGIDIRNGLQLECIACTACIDACDSIMDQVGKPQGLIRYDTENNLLGKTSKFFRPRIAVYAVILVGYGAVFSYLLSSRQTSEFDVVRANKDAPFTLTEQGLVTNHFTVRVSNKSDSERTYFFPPLVEPGVKLISPLPEFAVAAGKMRDVPIFVQLPIDLLSHGKLTLQLELRDRLGYLQTHQVTLLGPDKNISEGETGNDR